MDKRMTSEERGTYLFLASMSADGIWESARYAKVELAAMLPDVASVDDKYRDSLMAGLVKLADSLNEIEVRADHLDDYILELREDTEDENEK